MSFIELLLIGVGLSMDAFAVSICKGLNMKKINYKNGAIIALFFGVFQALMPLIGWCLGKQFEKYIVGVDHWIAFVLLSIIGGNMIVEAIRDDDDDDSCDCNNLKIKELFILAIATSIDALAVGVTFGLLPNTNIWVSISIIGVITFILSFIGVVIGNKFGSKYKSKAELFGGIILIAIGLKILIEHLFF